MDSLRFLSLYRPCLTLFPGLREISLDIEHTAVVPYSCLFITSSVHVIIFNNSISDAFVMRLIVDCAPAVHRIQVHTLGGTGTLDVVEVLRTSAHILTNLSSFEYRPQLPFSVLYELAKLPTLRYFCCNVGPFIASPRSLFGEEREEGLFPALTSLKVLHTSADVPWITRLVQVCSSQNLTELYIAVSSRSGELHNLLTAIGEHVALREIRLIMLLV